jgi:hypothetical protein
VVYFKCNYYGTHPSINLYGIIPLGSDIDYSAPHDHARFTQWNPFGYYTLILHSYARMYRDSLSFVKERFAA